MFKRKGKIVVCATVFVFMLCSSLFASGVKDSFEELNNSVNELVGGSGSKKKSLKQSLKTPQVKTMKLLLQKRLNQQNLLNLYLL